MWIFVAPTKYFAPQRDRDGNLVLISVLDVLFFSLRVFASFYEGPSYCLSQASDLRSGLVIHSVTSVIDRSISLLVASESTRMC